MLDYLNQEATAIVNDYRIPPVAVTTGQVEYPSDEQIRQALNASARNVYFVKATQKAEELGNVKVVNILLLGVLSVFFEISPEVWERIITKVVPDEFREINLRAFQTGRELIGQDQRPTFEG
jgi:indolepyruvate ferredoxin oxidoreductase beta subunit